MSSGSYSVNLDSYNRSGKTWSGANDPIQRKAFNSYTMTQYRYSSLGLEEWRTNAQGKYYLAGRAYYSALNPSLSKTLKGKFTKATLSEASSRAISDLTSQITGTGFNAGVFIGTTHQTLGSILSLTRGVITSYRYMRKGNAYGAFKALVRGISGASHPDPKLLRRSRKAGKKLALSGPPLNTSDVSQIWLGLRYGWQPLLSDIYELVDYLKTDVESQYVKYTGRGSSGQTVADFSSGTLTKSPGGFVRHNARRSVVMTCAPSKYAKLGLTDPASIAWELIPFSFVLDWFLPVGDTIRNYSILSSAGISTVHCTDFTLYECRVKGFWPYKNGVNPWTGGYVYRNGIADDREVTLKRYNSSLLNAIKPDFKVLSRSLSIGHLENAAALIHQLVRKD